MGKQKVSGNSAAAERNRKERWEKLIRVTYFNGIDANLSPSLRCNG
jgi:hypothetical protein